MAGGASNNNDDEISGINVTPLVDITLVLLIIFMVTAKMIVSQQIPIDIPKGVVSAGEAQVFFSVAIDKDSRIYVDKRQISTDEELRKLAKEALQKNKELRTVIQASQAVNHGTVIHVMDQLRQSGITKMGFAVDKTMTATGSKVTPKAP